MPLIFLLILLSVSCAPDPVIKYAESRYPQCEVLDVQTTKTHKIVSMKCPGDDIIEVRFRRK